MVVSASTTIAAEKSQERYPEEAKGFVEEMRFVAVKLHMREQAKEGEKEPQGKPVAKWEPSVQGYLKFLLDSKLVYDTLGGIVEKADFPEYSEFRNTQLERSERLAKDLKWFKGQGYAIPGHLLQVFVMRLPLKNYERRILRHSFATFTIYNLPTHLVVE